MSQCVVPPRRDPGFVWRLYIFLSFPGHSPRNSSGIQVKYENELQFLKRRKKKQVFCFLLVFQTEKLYSRVNWAEWWLEIVDVVPISWSMNLGFRSEFWCQWCVCTSSDSRSTSKKRPAVKTHLATGRALGCNFVLYSPLPTPRPRFPLCLKVENRIVQTLMRLM